MKKIIFLQSLILVLTTASPVFAQSTSGDISQIQTFIQNIIGMFVTIAGLTATAFLVYGGFRYITSSGNPEALDGAKKTVMYSAIGLAIVIGAYVISNIVTQTATTAFGTSH